MISIIPNFFCDADGKRIRKTQGSFSTLYFGETLEIINDTPTLYVFAGNLRIAKMTGSSTEYYHKDHQGSTNALTTESGSIIDTAEYLPYGPDRSPNGLLNHSAYKYTDQEQDAGTGLYNYDARLYDPVLGQFIMADTIVPDPFNPQSLNRFAYCLNNPVRYVDPTGHSYGSGTDGGSVSFGHDGSDAANAGDCPGGAGLDGYPDSWGLGRKNNPSIGPYDGILKELAQPIPNFVPPTPDFIKEIFEFIKQECEECENKSKTSDGIQSQDTDDYNRDEFCKERAWDNLMKALDEFFPSEIPNTPDNFPNNPILNT